MMSPSGTARTAPLVAAARGRKHGLWEDGVVQDRQFPPVRSAERKKKHKTCLTCN